MLMQQQIRRFILSNFLFTEDGTALNDSESLLEQGIMDSTGVLELVAFLESDFSIRVSDDELAPEHLDSVDRIAAFVAWKQSVGVAPAI
jgi:acyl carrier protein